MFSHVMVQSTTATSVSSGCGSGRCEMCGAVQLVEGVLAGRRAGGRARGRGRRGGRTRVFVPVQVVVRWVSSMCVVSVVSG